MRFEPPNEADAVLGLLLLGLLALGLGYGLAIWNLWKWVESGYK